MLTLDDINSAATVVYRHMQATPQYAWPLLREALGTEVWLKHENHTPAGAFKVRGGMVYFDRLHSREPLVTGVVSATRGNHGQSVARAATATGLRSVIVVPHGNSVEKNASMRSWGAELIEHGDDFTAAGEHASVLAERDGLHRVPSFHHDLVAGVATYVAELLRAVPDLDVIYVPIGLGSGACACIMARDTLGSKAQIIGVTSSGARGYKLAFDSGQCCDSVVTTQLADGMAVRAQSAEALAVLRGGLERIVEVSDAQVADAMRLIYSATHNVAEGAGAASMAAVMQDKSLLKGKKVAAVLCGGNVDSAVFAQVLGNTWKASD